MTTPAVNIYQRSYGAGSETARYQHADGSIDQDGPNPVDIQVGTYVKRRPDSVSIPLEGRYFRKAAPWQHDGLTARKSVRGHVRYFQSAVIPVGSQGYLSFSFDDGSFWPGLLPDQIDYPNDNVLVDRVVIKALSKLKAQTVNLGVAIAEAHQTADLIQSTMRRIAFGVNNWRKANPRKLWDKVLKHEIGGGIRRSHIPSSWLELQYGWNPLMSDVVGSMAALQKAWSQNPHVLTVRSSATDTSEYISNVSGPVASSCELKTRMTQQVGVSLSYELSNSFLSDVASLGLTNPLAIIWEKVPYSFVVDWFLPIANWLNVLDADFGLVFKTGAVSHLGRATCTAQNFRYQPTWLGMDSIDVQDPQISWRSFRFVRDVLSGTPMPGLHFKNPIGAYHVANAFSLLSQAFSPSGISPRHR